MFISITSIIIIMIMLIRYHRCQFNLSLPTTSNRRSQGFPPAELQVQVDHDVDADTDDDNDSDDADHDHDLHTEGNDADAKNAAKLEV